MIWGSVLGFPGGIVRLNPGSNPPETALAEYYEVPWHNPKAHGFGIFAARHGYRSQQCGVGGAGKRPLGQLRPAKMQRAAERTQGHRTTLSGRWTLYPTPGTEFRGMKESGSADSHYYDWVDQFDTLGLGKNTPIITGNSSDSLIALVNGKFVIMRVPYPLGFFAKGMDGRVDDPKAGWKGKGLWTTWGTRTPFHSETGKGTTSKVVHFQIRPNPLAD